MGCQGRRGRRREGSRPVGIARVVGSSAVAVVADLVGHCHVAVVLVVPDAHICVSFELDKAGRQVED